jgi:membrane protein implicated in regulation of membrane protease activity
MLIYAAIGTFGLLFLLVMLFVGEVFGGDHDVGAVDAGGHGDFGHEGGPSIFSGRIMASFLTAFGAGGVVGRYMGWSHPAASGLGIVTGALLASAVYQFAHILYSQQASSEVRMTGLVGQTAQVTVAIPATGHGQVTIISRGEQTSQIARSPDGTPIPAGALVMVTALAGDSLIVVPAASRDAAAGDRV